MKVGDMVRPIPFGPTRGRQRDPWLDRVGIIIGFEEERDYAGVTVEHMPVVYWGNDFTSEVEYREQVEVISVVPRSKSNIVERRRSSQSVQRTMASRDAWHNIEN